MRELMHWDWAAAEAAFRRAITLNSGDDRAHHELGQLLMRTGRCDEALVEERRAMALAPESVPYQSGIGEIDRYCRRFDDALREFRNGFIVRGDSSHIYWDLAETYFGQGQYRTALAMYEKSGDPPPGWAYAALGSRQQALDEIASLKGRIGQRKSDEWTYWTLAKLCVGLGNHAEATGWLERMYEERNGLLIYLKVEPHFDPLRGEPRFEALMRKVGLGD
jgi:serine/threonine-protein kinase